jgi:hypothetical protein
MFQMTINPKNIDDYTFLLKCTKNCAALRLKLKVTENILNGYECSLTGGTL